jgi:hypothetical protein
LLKLSYVFKEAAGQDHEAGIKAWLCPVYSSTGQTAVAVQNDTAITPHATPILTWGITPSAGTTANTGKFVLNVTMDDVTGVDNGFLTWVVEILHSNHQRNSRRSTGTRID